MLAISTCKYLKLRLAAALHNSVTVMLNETFSCQFSLFNKTTLIEHKIHTVIRIQERISFHLL